MNKKFFYYALTALISYSMTACNSDDDEQETEYEVDLQIPETADNAVEFNLPKALKGEYTSNQTDSDYELTSIEVTESEKVMVTMRDTKTGKTTYMMEDADHQDNVYVVDGPKMKGFVQPTESDTNEQRTKAGEDVGLIISLTVHGLAQTVSFATPQGSVTSAVAKSAMASSEANANRLIRTWNILGAIIDLKGDNIKAYEEFDSRNGVLDLNDVKDEAKTQGLKLSQEDENALDRKIKSVTFTRSGKFIVTYADGKEDVAEWEWANSAKTQIKIRLKEDDMGNKFLTDNSIITFAFNGNRCNVKVETNLTDKENSRWDAVLTLKLQSAD